MKSRRPIISIERTRYDKVLDTIGWVFLLALWAFVLNHYNDLPDIIPTHFNLAGEVDDYGRKWIIFLLPIIATLIYGFFSMMAKHPDKLNYPVKITEENARYQYVQVIRYLRYMKLGVVILFSTITLEAVFIAMHLVHSLKPWMLPVLLLLIFIPLIVYLLRAFKK